jgi:hypothetical protein
MAQKFSDFYNPETVHLVYLGFTIYEQKHSRDIRKLTIRFI